MPVGSHTVALSDRPSLVPGRDRESPAESDRRPPDQQDPGPQSAAPVLLGAWGEPSFTAVRNVTECLHKLRKFGQVDLVGVETDVRPHCRRKHMPSGILRCISSCACAIPWPCAERDRYHWHLQHVADCVASRAVRAVRMECAEWRGACVGRALVRVRQRSMSYGAGVCRMLYVWRT